MSRAMIALRIRHAHHALSVRMARFVFVVLCMVPAAKQRASST